MGMCKYCCTSITHANENENSYCMKHLWHEDVLKVENENQTLAQGHLLNCKHADSPHMYVLI